MIIFPFIRKTTPRFYNSSWFPLYFRGIMIPFIGIIIRDKYIADNELHQHELIHWNQFQRMGLVMFLFRYLFQLIFIGYDTMPMEMEARQFIPTAEAWNYRKTYFK